MRAIRTASQMEAEIQELAAVVVIGLHRSPAPRPRDSVHSSREMLGSTLILMRGLALHKPRRPLVVPTLDRSLGLSQKQNQSQHQSRTRSRNQNLHQV